MLITPRHKSNMNNSFRIIFIKIIIIKANIIYIISYIIIRPIPSLMNVTISELFFPLEFSFTDTEDSQDSKGREGPSFIPLYHFHPLTKSQTFICNFACEMIITYFQSHRLYLPDCYSMRFTTLSNYHLID